MLTLPVAMLATTASTSRPRIWSIMAAPITMRLEAARDCPVVPKPGP